MSVANDFNIFQFLSMQNISKPWWIIPPEHINYFRINDIKKLFNKKSFKIIDINSSFPIEIFLLMGQNYIKNNHIENIHINKELNLKNNLKIKI